MAPSPTEDGLNDSIEKLAGGNKTDPDRQEPHSESPLIKTLRSIEEPHKYPKHLQKEAEIDLQEDRLRTSSSGQNEYNMSHCISGTTESEPVLERLAKAPGGKSSSTCKPYPKKKVSQSHTKVHTCSSANVSKPNMSRSKSTDGIIPKTRLAFKCNTRSHTKLTALQPLTKTMLNSSPNRALGVLQPLVKTMLRESLKQYGLRKTLLNGLVKSTHMALTKTNLSQLIKLAKFTSSLKSLTQTSGARHGTHSKSNSSLKALAGAPAVGLNTSAKRGKAILKLNEDDEYYEYEDTSNASDEGKEPPATERLYEYTTRGQHQNDFAGSRSASAQSIHTYAHDGPLEGDPQDASNLYGGSFLLSQSTGMTRKIKPFTAAKPSEKNEKTVAEIGPIGDNASNMGLDKSSSGILFRPKIEDTEHDTVPQGSYQPNQTIFSNLQRNDSQYLSNIKQLHHQNHQNQQLAATTMPDPKRDFSTFLTSQQGNTGQNIETRTQQRLWLQRENSLLDVSENMDLSRVGNFSNLSLNNLMFAHNYSNPSGSSRETPGSVATLLQNSESRSNTGETLLSTPSEASSSSMNAANMLHLIQNGQQNSIQSRTEFERINREYVNVRRHVNPVAESLNRLEKHEKSEKTSSGQPDLDVPKRNSTGSSNSCSNSNANSFKEFASLWENRDGEAVMMLNKVWQEAFLLSSSVTLSARILQQEQQRQHHMQHQRLGEYSNQSLSQDVLGTSQMKQQHSSLVNSFSRSISPATRALKMAMTQASAEIRQR